MERVDLHGEWGSGKTSLMRMIEDVLKEEKMIKTVWFDAWKFDKSHDLRVALIGTVLREIKNDNDKNISGNLKEKAGNLLKRVN